MTQLPRRRLVQSLALLPGAAALARAEQAAAQPGEKVLRYAFPVAETGFDPVQISDLYSRYVTAHIFEAPYGYDHFARPFKLKPCTAAALPEVSADFRTYTIRIRPGIYFQDDPAFGGKRRELTAHDYVYSWKRFYDPRWKAPYVAVWLISELMGMNEYRDEVLKTKKPFDYDKPIEGLRVLDRYTLQIRLNKSDPRLIYNLAVHDVNGAVAREVVERYGDDIMAHPVGTGPFRLAAWQRSSRIELVRSASYRVVRWEAQPNADDVAGQKAAEQLRGRRLPLLDRVVISIVNENQPRYLAFANREHDLLFGVPLDYANLAVPGGRLAPHFARHGVELHRILNADVAMTVYNMEHPVIGGYAPERVALRRALNLAIDVDAEIRIVRRGQAIPAQSPVMPNTYGYDPTLKSEMGDFDLARARALLDTYGYVDRNGDGWREQPDGSPLVFELSSQPDQISRQLDELLQKNIEALGIRFTVNLGQWPEQLRAARAGKFMAWGVGLSAASPDGQGVFARGYGPEAGGQNLARFKLPEFDRIYERMQTLPDGPERLALFREANRILIAYAPYKFHVHRYVNDLTYPWVIGYRRPPFWADWWQYVDVDAGAQARALL
jgi:ABC-type transport system substrate-binding protein